MINKIKHFLAHWKHRVCKPEPQITDSGDIHITNETIAARREEVLGSARKYIYPLQASKYRIVKLSIGILIAAIIVFFGFCTLETLKVSINIEFYLRSDPSYPIPGSNCRQHVSGFIQQLSF